MSDPWHCRCGVPREPIYIDELGALESTTIPGPLQGFCRCPRCITCGQALDDNDRCQNLGCSLLGVHILIADRPEPWPREG